MSYLIDAMEKFFEDNGIGIGTLSREGTVFVFDWISADILYKQITDFELEFCVGFDSHDGISIEDKIKNCHFRIEP